MEEILKEKSKVEFFNRMKDLKEIFATEDGNFFYNKPSAINHSNGKLNIFHFVREHIFQSKDESKKENIEQVKSQGDTVAKNIEQVKKPVKHKNNNK
jgi:hypothetical protein